MTQVNHPILGTGSIISQDANNITIDFNGVIKTLIIKFAKLTNEDGTAFGAQAIAAPVKNKKRNAAMASNFIPSSSNRPSEWDAMNRNSLIAEHGAGFVNNYSKSLSHLANS